MLLGRQGVKYDTYGGKWPKQTQNSQVSLKNFFSPASHFLNVKTPFGTYQQTAEMLRHDR